MYRSALVSPNVVLKATLFALVACSGHPGPGSRDSDSHAGGDVDTDADSDVDVDADADGDTGWDPGSVYVLRGQGALDGGAVTEVTGFGGSDCGDWVSVGAQGVIVHCSDPVSGSSTSQLLHRVDGAALLEGRAEVLATLSGAFVGHGSPRASMADLDGDALDEIGLRDGAGSGSALGFVVPGSGWVADAALEDVAWSLVGENGYVGIPPQIVGDLDGDGAADLIVAHQSDFYADDQSVGSWLILVPGGSLRGTAPGATVQVSRLPGYVLQATHGLGAPRVIGGVGDLDGDGLQDVGVAFGPWDEPGPDQAGDVRIVLSSTLGTVTLDECPALSGVQVGRLMETLFEPLGDLDGDGRGEVAVGFVEEGSSGSDSRHLEFGIVRGADVAPGTTTMLTPWAADLQGYSGVACDLDGDLYPDWVTADGIWSGAHLLDPDPAPMAAGRDASACLGDLDADGVQELAL